MNRETELVKYQDELKREIASLKEQLAKAQEAQRIPGLDQVREEIVKTFGGMGKGSSIWSNSPYDKGRCAGITAALTAFDHARGKLEPIPASGSAELRPEPNVIDQDGVARAAADVIEAARFIRHWHYSGPNNEGMIVSSHNVMLLWDALGKYDKAVENSASPRSTDRCEAIANDPDALTGCGDDQIDPEVVAAIRRMIPKGMTPEQFADAFNALGPTALQDHREAMAGAQYTDEQVLDWFEAYAALGGERGLVTQIKIGTEGSGTLREELYSLMSTAGIKPAGKPEGFTDRERLPLPEPPAVETLQSNGTEDRREANWDESRCRVCGWPLADEISKGCVKGNCSLRPTPAARADVAPQVAEKVSMAELAENFIQRPGDIDRAWVSAGIRAILERVGAADRIIEP